MNNYKKYKLLDYFMRSEDRVFNLNKRPNALLTNIIDYNFDIDVSESKMFTNNDNDMIIISTKNVVAREYIQYEGKKVLLILLPTSLRTDDYSIKNKIITLTNIMYDKSECNNNSIYGLQDRLLPLLYTTVILGDMYSPFSDLADLIIDTIFIENTINETDRKNIKDMMEYINSINDDKFRNDLFNNSGIFTIINKDLAKTIVNSYIL